MSRTEDAQTRARDAAGGAMAEFLDGLVDLRQPQVLPTGLSELDETLCGGIRPSQLTVIAGVPGTGTSMFALGIARRAAIANAIPTLYVAPDSQQKEILARIVSAEAKVPLNHLRSGLTTKQDLELAIKVRSKLDAAPLILSTHWLRDADQLVHQEVNGYAQAINGLGLVVVDVSPDSIEVIRGLKVAAQTHRLAVVLCVNAKRRDQNADVPRPRMGDLTLADDLGEFADLVLGVHRADMYDAESTRPGEADLEVLKNRCGPTRLLAPIAFQGHYARFVDMAN